MANSSASPVSTVVTFLEMTTPPKDTKPDFGARDIRLTHQRKLPLPLYRQLYDAVGRDYLWVNRKWWSDEKLAATIHDDGVEIHCLYADDQIAGFTEIDFRLTPDVEITFFGLLPQFLGKGMSRPFLDTVLQRAWRAPTTRVHLQTCTHDHPAALPLYQKAGFTAFGRTTETLVPFPDDSSY